MSVFSIIFVSNCVYLNNKKEAKKAYQINIEK